MTQSSLAASADAAGTVTTPADEPVSRAFRRLLAATTGLALVLIAMGGAVRATDSGLACPDWPRCYGMWIPPADVNIWIEHTHRLIAGVVASLLWVLAVWALRRFRARGDILAPILLAWVLVHVQALLGALVVWHLLRADLVTAHLGMAMVVVGCLIAATVAASLPASRGAWSPLARGSAAVAVLALAQILVGGHVTGIGASLVFTDFPTMGGTMLPELRTPQESFHVLHRALAFVLLFAAAALTVAARRRRADLRDTVGGAMVWATRLPLWATGLIVLQIAIGVANLWSRTSYLTVIPHLAVASWIWSVLVLQVLLARRLPVAAQQGSR